LSSNKLQGALPAELGITDLLAMTKLQMNNLDGHVANSFSNMNKLEVFYLGQNSFTGDMPSTVIQLPILCYTNLHGKQAQRNNSIFDQFTAVSNDS